MLATDKNGMPIIRMVDGRRYAECREPIVDVSIGTTLNEYCGALVDVTDWQVVRVATDTCGNERNHQIRHWTELGG